jgi:hypothetical protein
MYADLHAAMGFGGANDAEVPWQGMVLIKDGGGGTKGGGGEGAVLLHHYISMHLRAGTGIVLVGFEQNIGHYSSVQRRFGTQRCFCPFHPSLSFMCHTSQPHPTLAILL